MSLLNFSLPFTNPVLQFSLLLLIILFAPVILSRFRIPSLISLILAGAVIGPFGLNLLLRDSSIVLFGTVGLLYIMFLAGLEIDVADFRKNSGKSILFGLYTFFISLSLGILVGLYVLHFALLSSVLIGSIFASHTLIIYPVISKLGIAKNKAVNIALGGTIITDTLALLVLAIVAGTANGEIMSDFWLRLIIGITLFSLVVLLLFPIIARWFFKRFDDSVLQYLFVLAMVFFSGFLAEAAGVEAIIGAFLGGLALNQLIPRTSALMNRIKFVGNAIFIPFFLIGVGMLIDIRAFFKDYESIKVAAVITLAATIAKYLSAWITQKLFGFSLDQRRLIFGLISAHAAVALATVLIGYNTTIGYTIKGEPIRLLGESVLNGTILFILITCTLATVIGEKGAHNIARSEAADDVAEKGVTPHKERILIHTDNLATVDELVNLSVTMTSDKTPSDIYAMHVADNSLPDDMAEKYAEKVLEKAVITASSTDNEVTGLLRYDNNITNGISGVIREQKITDLILGLHHKNPLTDDVIDNHQDSILGRCNVTTLIYKSVQPLATIKRTIAVIPENAEHEIGFSLWLQRLINMTRNTGSKLVIYASQKTIASLQESALKLIANVEYKVFKEWDNFWALSNVVKSNDNLIVVMSRKHHHSYHAKMAKLPAYLNKYFQQNSFILIYPVQTFIPEESVEDILAPPVKTSVINLESVKTIFKKVYKRK